MAETALTDRKKIGLLFTGNYNWTGGLYYVLNIIHALNRLPDEEQPGLVVFFNKETPPELLKEIAYAHLQLHDLDDLGFFSKASGKLTRILSGRNYRVEKAINPYRLTALYPMSEYFSDLHGLNCPIVYWLYDFQHKFLPQFFSKAELEKREHTFLEIIEHARTIVVSSEDAAAHLRKFYPAYAGALKVLRFVSILDTYKITNKRDLEMRYALPSSYFLVANQFWQHKNHLDVLEALALAKKQGNKMNVVFTGKQHDHRNPDHFKNIVAYAASEGLAEQLIFTGFISREDQLGLMQHCLAVIQPSRFEGWSTVIEDAKALGKQVIASGLAVHHEQLGDTAVYFEPGDPKKLSQLMSGFTAGKEENIPDRSAAVEQFARDLLLAMNG
jgi:glycosyltransferase involved in cell wall biosynthesis